MPIPFQSYQFTALKDFWCEETQSQYVKGLSYTVRDPEQYKDNPAAKKRCEALVALAPQWIKDGKVRLGGPGGAEVRGG